MHLCVFVNRCVKRFRQTRFC